MEKIVWGKPAVRKPGTQNDFQRKGIERRSRNQIFGLRREAKRHAALAPRSAIEERFRRCALSPQSKIFSARGGSNVWHHEGAQAADPLPRTVTEEMKRVVF
jgi:hypothetical protein